MKKLRLKSARVQQIHKLLRFPLETVQPMSTSEWNELLTRERRRERRRSLELQRNGRGEHTKPPETRLTSQQH